MLAHWARARARPERPDGSDSRCLCCFPRTSCVLVGLGPRGHKCQQASRNAKDGRETITVLRQSDWGWGGTSLRIVRLCGGRA